MFEAVGLTKIFREHKALQSVDLFLKTGEVHALLGENSAGKSTLINLLVGTFAPSNGRLQMDGREYSAITPALARELGISAVFQEFSLAPDLTVLENIFTGPREAQGRLSGS